MPTIKHKASADVFQLCYDQVTLPAGSKFLTGLLLGGIAGTGG